MFNVDKLKVETGDGLNCTLLEAFTYTRNDGKVITVPVGSTSDGASSPRILWRVLPPFGPYWKAAFLHDYLYRNSTFPKEFCDETFLEAMKYLGVSDFETFNLYEGVHLGGESAFDEDRELQNKSK